MCSCDTPDVVRTVTRTARKRHRCEEGNHPIQPGDSYVYISGVWDGRGASFRHCLTCHVLFFALQNEADDCGPCLGELAEYVAEWLSNEYPQPDRWALVGEFFEWAT